MTRRLLNHGWIFVSHSNRDIKKVRRVRNRLERLNAQPLLFLLKATFQKPELRNLLYREIEARNFFLYCRSANAERSRWVQDELRHVKSLLPGKVFIEIDLDWPWPRQRRELDRLHRHSSVFLSYSRRNREEVSWFEQLLIQNEFTVWRDDQIEAGEDWAQAISREISAVASAGYFIVFLSAAALESSWLWAELQAADAARETLRQLLVIELEPNLTTDAFALPDGVDRLEYVPDRQTQGLRLLRKLGLDKPSVVYPDLDDQHEYWD